MDEWAKTEINRQSRYLSMMVGVDALIASWCKIFKPESHLVASSFESAGKMNGNGMLCYTLGRPPLDLLTLAPRLPSPGQTVGVGEARAHLQFCSRAPRRHLLRTFKVLRPAFGLR